MGDSVSEGVVEPSGSPRWVRPQELDLRLELLRIRTRAASCRAQALIDSGIWPVLVATEAMFRGVLVLLWGFEELDLLRTQSDRVPVQVVSAAGVAAHALVLQLHASCGGLSELEEAWIVQALHRQEGLSQVEIASRLGRHKSWVCRRLKLAEGLHGEVLEDVRAGLVSVAAGRELARLPRGNQPAVARSIVEHRLTSRQAGRLADLFVQHRQDSRAWADLLANPLPHLMDGRRKPPDDPRLSANAARLRCELFRLAASARRLEESFVAHPPAQYTPIEQEVLGPAAQGAAPALAAIQGELGWLASLAERGN